MRFMVLFHPEYIAIVSEIKRNAHLKRPYEISTQLSIGERVWKHLQLHKHCNYIEHIWSHKRYNNIHILSGSCMNDFVKQKLNADKDATTSPESR